MAYQIVDADYVLDNLGTLPLVDVRPGFMYEESRIPGAISIQLIEAKESLRDTAEYFVEGFTDANLDPQDEFIVYCYDGGLAREACDLLESQGYTGQQCYAGSWVDWISDDTRPIEQ